MKKEESNIAQRTDVTTSSFMLRQIVCSAKVHRFATVLIKLLSCITIFHYISIILFIYLFYYDFSVMM